MKAIAKTQQQAIEEAEKILEGILRNGIASLDIEYREEVCYDIEGLIDYYSPNLLRSFRHLFSLLSYVDNPEKYPALIAQVNYLLSVYRQTKPYLKLRAEGADHDVNSNIESHLGYLWKKKDMLEYKLYEQDAEIIQLSFNSTKNADRMAFFDKGYWFDLKTGEIHCTQKIRPYKAAQFIKENNTEFDVLQPEKLFLYPSKVNRRIRWEKAEKRKLNPNDITILLNSAETNYAKVISEVKESFRDPLAKRNPAVLITLHEAFINGEHLVLEDDHGGRLTVADLEGDTAPTTELLQAILPSKPIGCALLVEVNDNIQARLFSVKPLSMVTSDRIIRLLY